MSGVGIALKERNPEVKIYLADCMGSGIYSWYARREFKPEGNSITEGIGNNRETKNLAGFAPDGQFQITDEEMLPVLFGLVEDEGLVLGGSTGINVCGAIRLARLLGPGHAIVTILADSGTRYSRNCSTPLFSPNATCRRRAGWKRKCSFSDRAVPAKAGTHSQDRTMFFVYMLAE